MNTFYYGFYVVLCDAVVLDTTSITAGLEYLGRMHQLGSEGVSSWRLKTSRQPEII